MADNENSEDSTKTESTKTNTVKYFLNPTTHKDTTIQTTSINAEHNIVRPVIDTLKYTKVTNHINPEDILNNPNAPEALKEMIRKSRK